MGSVESGPGRGVWKVGPSNIHGQGVLTTQELRAGSRIGVGIGYRLGIIPAITSDFGAWINHSYQPSASLMFLDGMYWVVAAKNLAPGDEVTVDYRRTPWYVKGPEFHYR